MTVEQKIAKSLVKNFGYEEASAQTKVALDRAMEDGSFRAIEEQHFWREVLIEMMKWRH